MARGKLPDQLPNAAAEGESNGHLPEVPTELPTLPATPDDIPMIPIEVGAALPTLPDLPDEAGAPFDIFAGL